ncbi:TetR/AcrR family transcriptional regulator [Priestia megaterium]|uniref:TetR/AcrR family transcriptional regulator n=1 Tax=Priestia megaterium TaxID=1404 RepID=UPI003C2B117F
MVNDENTPRTRPERRDAAMNRQRILDTAHKLFEQYGVEQVSMNQIATEAQIGPGTLYRRYRNKGELCLDLIKDSIDLFFDDIEAYLQENETVPAEQKLKEVISSFICFREKKHNCLQEWREQSQRTQLSPEPKALYMLNYIRYWFSYLTK